MKKNFIICLSFILFSKADRQDGMHEPTFAPIPFSSIMPNYCRLPDKINGLVNCPLTLTWLEIKRATNHDKKVETPNIDQNYKKRCLSEPRCFSIFLQGDNIIYRTYSESFTDPSPGETIHLLICCDGKYFYLYIFSYTDFIFENFVDYFHYLKH